MLDQLVPANLARSAKRPILAEKGKVKRSIEITNAFSENVC